MEVSFYLKRPNNTTPTNIFCRICYEGYKVKYYTPENVLPIFWNKETQRIRETKKFPENPEFNRRLDSIETIIKNTLRKYINDNEGAYPTPEKLKPLLDGAIKDGGKTEKVTFQSFFKEFINRCENGTRINSKTGKPINPGTIKTYKATLACFENYQLYARRKVDFDSVDMHFYSEFNKYMTLKLKLSTNYIGKHIKVIKTVLHDATALKFNTNLAFTNSAFISLSEEADTVSLSTEELKDLSDLDLSLNPPLDRIRDLFLIGCHTGLRFSDLSSLRPSQIENGIITLTQIKTKTPIKIPVHNIVKEIMIKYNGELPQAITNQKTNDYLKVIGEQVPSLCKLNDVTITKGGEKLKKTVPKWKLISTHTARRSFATNEYLAGTPSLHIMAITGHKTEKAFMKYIRITSDIHAKQLQGIWNERNRLIEEKEEAAKNEMSSTTTE